MKNYYKILNVKNNTEKEEINQIYFYKISKFINLPFYTKQMKDEIKNLKEAQYILLDDTRRKKYDKIINKKEDYNNTKINERLFSLKI